MRNKILIIDDTPENIQVLLATLQDEYIVTAANNGAKGIELAHTHPQPDLILLDIMMPDLDGYEVCRLLKSDAATKNIPIIFVSALRETEDEEKGLKLGGIDYLRKPITPALVSARVKNHIQLYHLQRALEKHNKVLLEAAKLRDDVERVVRHDIKSPLSVILGYPELIEMDNNLNAQQVQGLHEITVAGQRILDMVNRSLNLYKMEEGLYQYQAMRVNLSTILQEVITECSVIAKNYSVSVNYDPEAFNCDLLGEALLCHTMFTNLLKNAIEASPVDGHVDISISSEECFCIVAIHNSGAVPNIIREHFFDKFTSSGKIGGTGLGTYSAKMCAEIQRGEILLKTDEISGTTITVKLHLDKEALIKSD